MIFSLVSSAQEWLNVKWDEFKANEEARAEAKLKEFEEAERVSIFGIKDWFELNLMIIVHFQKRFEGTRVTVETFLTWRNEFEADTGILLRREKAMANSSKLTGKELFLRDQSLIDSDLKFLLAEGESIENVKVDESLFQNIDDLDLGSDDDDDDDDDEDYVPGKHD